MEDKSFEWMMAFLAALVMGIAAVYITDEFWVGAIMCAIMIWRTRSWWD